MGQSQSSLHVPADGLETFLELLITVVFLAATGIIATIVLVTTFGHRWDANVKLQNNRFLCVNSLFWPKQKMIMPLKVTHKM